MDVKRSLSCCCRGHNLHVGVTVLRTLSAISFFPSDIYIFNFLLEFGRIICTIFLCKKKKRSPCSFKRKGPSHLFNYTCTGHREFALRERKDEYFCTFNDFNTFAQLSFPSLPQISTSFSQPCLYKTPIFLACELSGKESRHYILMPITCYYAQYRMRSATLRNNLNFDKRTGTSFFL